MQETRPYPPASAEVTPFYHVIARCVRRHFLCGIDPLTGKDYSARKHDIKDRLSILADVFAIDVCAYAILSNHYHKRLCSLSWFMKWEPAHHTVSLLRRPWSTP